MGIQGLDTAVAQFFDGTQTPDLTAVFRTITNLGGVMVMTTVTVALVVGLALVGRRRAAALLALGMSVSVLITVVAKLLVARDRPDATFRPLGLPAETSHSFPSGHTLNSTTFVIIVVALLWPALRLTWQRVTACAVAALWVAAEGTSRLYLGYHWLTDVVAGLAIGVVWATIVIAWSRTWRLADRPRPA